MNTHRKQRDIHGFLFKTAAILLMLVLVSTSLVTGRYARYTTTAESSDSARVAKFEVTGVKKNDVSIECKTTDSGECVFSVNNESEVAISYTIGVSTDNLDKLTVKLDGNNGTENGNLVSFTASKTLAPGATGTDHTLSFTVDQWDFVTAVDDGDSDSGKTKLEQSFAIHITATQID